MTGIAGIGSGQAGWPDLSAIKQNLFAKIDSNGDGQVSPDELVTFGQNLPGSLVSGPSDASSTASSFSQIDTNGDGSISKDELTAYSNKLSDSNNASLLQEQEGSGGSNGAGGAGRAHHHHHHGGGGGGSSSASSSQATDANTLLSELDTDQDGSLSPQEWAAQASTGSAASTYASAQTSGQTSTDPLLQLVDKLIG